MIQSSNIINVSICFLVFVCLFPVPCRRRQLRSAQHPQAEAQKTQEAQEETPQLCRGPGAPAHPGAHPGPRPSAPVSVQTEDQTGGPDSGHQEVSWLHVPTVNISVYLYGYMITYWDCVPFQCSHLHRPSWRGSTSLTADDPR